jgi:hypothetical protein
MTMSERLTPEEQQTLSKTILEANEQGWGIALGLLFGVGLLVATNVLVIKGGAYVGWHLRLLRVYFPGYSVTFVGSLVGFVYAFVVGYGIGRTIVAIYNRLTASMR